jgi:hypothetical protein
MVKEPRIKWPLLIIISLALFSIAALKSNDTKTNAVGAVLSVILIVSCLALAVEFLQRPRE